MDSFTRDFFQVAWDEMTRHRKQPPTLYQLKARAMQCWLEWRDRRIYGWARETQARVPQSRLCRISHAVVDMLVDAGQWGYDYIPGEYYDDVTEPPPGKQPNEWIAQVTALGIANLRWINREARGWEPSLSFNDADLAHFIESQLHPVQLALF